MTPLTTLLKLYGPAALYSPTRLLHERVQQLELQLAIEQEKRELDKQVCDASTERKEQQYLELQERVFKKEQLPSTLVSSEPLKVKRHKASRVRDKIAKMMREEDMYYKALSDAASKEPDSAQ